MERLSHQSTKTYYNVVCVFQISDIPSVRYFCIYAATAVLIDYCFQVTLFAGCMVLSGRREMDKKHAITFKQIQPKSEARKYSVHFVSDWHDEQQCIISGIS